MFKQAWVPAATAIAFTASIVSPQTSAQTAPVWAIAPSSAARVVIDPKTTVRASLPRTLYSFNMRYNLFEQELFDRSAWAVKKPITDQILPMPQAFYRYPGGLIANHFPWEKAALSVADRKAARKAGGTVMDYPYFGTAEYLNWMSTVKGTAWWTLNLVGAGSTDNIIEYPSSTIAASNKKLAQYLKTNHPGQTQWLYQLGNELDRNKYEWDPSKYVARSRDTINAMLSVDPSAKFVAFMREFGWKYKYTKTGTSTAQDFFTTVMQGLPMINDFSLHFYYDGKLSPTSRYVTVPDMLNKTQKALGMAKTARAGNYNVWITEHSKRLYLSGGTSPAPDGLDAGVSVGDFLLGMTQVPEVKGAGLQGLQGTPRTTFFKDTLQGTPAFWALRMLNAQPYSRVLASRTSSPNNSAYPGGYDVRAVGFIDSTGTKLAVSAVNRHKQATSLEINFTPFAGMAKSVKQYSISGPAGVDASTIDRTYTLVTAPTAKSKTFSSTGSVQITLPPSSVSTITFQ